MAVAIASVVVVVIIVVVVFLYRCENTHIVHPFGKSRCIEVVDIIVTSDGNENAKKKKTDGN